jgi:hypothetical protein
MANIKNPEFLETQTQSLPPAGLEVLKQIRDDACSSSLSRDFKLQTHQRFLRRVLSPDSPVRNLLMVHGTGVGKTCTGIQIAEEFIIRPEFQDKKVLIIASSSIQDSFKSQIFDVSRLSQDDSGLILSKQCTGRRYLEMIQRVQREPIKLTDRASQYRIMEIASKFINEFYEFQGYIQFSNIVENVAEKTPDNLEKFIHDTFDNRLIIIDEAHNIRKVTGDQDIIEGGKLVALSLERVLKTAKGVTLILLTATPMFDTYDEILFYFNLFLWNDRRLENTKEIKSSEIFDKDGSFKKDKETLFRSWCQDYVSFVRGENPFTFPFRLPPPEENVAKPAINSYLDRTPIRKPRKFLTLTRSIISTTQAEAIEKVKESKTPSTDPRFICVFPENKSFEDVFSYQGGQYSYRDGDDFLKPSRIAEYSSKFALVTKIINDSDGIAFVYSNLVTNGAQLFAMALEEAGYVSAIGNDLLANTSGEVVKGSKGRYVLFTSNTSDADIRKAIVRMKSPNNKNGNDIKVVISSPKISEGVDFWYIRQVHILDPWFNMSRIEQVIGRGLRSCSHQALPFEQQNCTVYLHVCQYADGLQETYDEYVYRAFIEEKAVKIAGVKKVIMESAMDCSLQDNINNLPDDWRIDLKIPQIRSQDKRELNLTLVEMSAPIFQTDSKFVCNTVESKEDTKHVRPLSSVLDVREEIINIIGKLLIQKPIWSQEDLFKQSDIKKYDPNVVYYIIQNIIQFGVLFKDKLNRVGHLSSKGNLFVFSLDDHNTMSDLITKKDIGSLVPLTERVKAVTTIAENDLIKTKREKYAFPPYMTKLFDTEILDWYIVDHVLTEDERTQHILNLNWNNPPLYAKPSEIVVSEDKKLYVLGTKKIYDESKTQITPIGVERQAYDEWAEKLKSRFTSKFMNIFAAMKDEKLLFNLDENSTEIKKVQRTKGIGGRGCSNYKESILNSFAEWLGYPFSKEVGGKKDRCLFLALAVRKAILDKKDGLTWFTSAEWEVLNEDRKELKNA